MERNENQPQPASPQKEEVMQVQSPEEKIAEQFYEIVKMREGEDDAKAQGLREGEDLATLWASEKHARKHLLFSQGHRRE